MCVVYSLCIYLINLSYLYLTSLNFWYFHYKDIPLTNMSLKFIMVPNNIWSTFSLEIVPVVVGILMIYHVLMLVVPYLFKALDWNHIHIIFITFPIQIYYIARRPDQLVMCNKFPIYIVRMMTLYVLLK